MFYVEVFSLYAIRQQTYSELLLCQIKENKPRQKQRKSPCNSKLCLFGYVLLYWQISVLVFCFGLGFFVRGELFKHVILQYRESYIKVILGFFPCIKFSRKTFVVLTTALY